MLIQIEGKFVKVAIGDDHPGFELKEHIKDLLLQLRDDALDLDTDGTAPVDYPDSAAGFAVRDGKSRFATAEGRPH